MSDLISRQAAINAIENTDCELSPKDWDELTDAIVSLPSAETPTVSEKHQLSEETPTDTSTDLISRQDAIEAVATVTMSIHLSNVLCDKLLALPSADAVQIPIKLEKRYPQSRDEDITDAFMRGYLAGRSSADRPTGEWVVMNGDVVCSECGNSVSFSRTKDGWVLGKFCQTCGAKMVREDGEEE